MNDSNNNVEEALNNIFGDDFIEINSDIDETKEEKNKTLNIANVNEENDYGDVKRKDNIKFEELLNDIAYKVKEDLSSDNTDNLKNEKNSLSTSDFVAKENNFKKKEDKFFNKKLIIYFVIGILLGIIFLVFVLYFLLNKEVITICSYTAKDDGYKVTDEYKITRKNNEILYVQGNYNYIALNEEFKKQIEYIKDEKVAVIINSNGMDGFTYIYELGDDFFQISSYLDFSKFKYKQIAKIDQKRKPISFFEVNEGINYKKLNKSLEKDGYKCVNK